MTRLQTVWALEKLERVGKVRGLQLLLQVFLCVNFDSSDCFSHIEVVSVVNRGCMACTPVQLRWMIALMGGQCLVYFSGAVIKRHDQGILEKKEVFIEGLQFQRKKSPSWQGGIAAGTGS